MTPQFEVARFLAGSTLLEPIRQRVTEEGCQVVTWKHLNRFGEHVEHVTLSGVETDSGRACIEG